MNLSITVLMYVVLVYIHMYWCGAHVRGAFKLENLDISDNVSYSYNNYKAILESAGIFTYIMSKIIQ